MRVNSLGDCLKNAQPPPEVELSDSQSVKRQYLFHLGFENSIKTIVCRDNRTESFGPCRDKSNMLFPIFSSVDVTEKLSNPLGSGTRPVYMGAPNIRDHSPPNLIISLARFWLHKKVGTVSHNCG